ncbi:hypothetical protein AM609_14015 [Actinomyces sp. oral taxon 414]|nr:hypothetical protein AM609_14015 [Actinomyces sp. oral taxon 414]
MWGRRARGVGIWVLLGTYVRDRATDDRAGGSREAEGDPASLPGPGEHRRRPRTGIGTKGPGGRCGAAASRHAAAALESPSQPRAQPGGATRRSQASTTS